MRHWLGSIRGRIHLLTGVLVLLAVLGGMAGNLALTGHARDVEALNRAQERAFLAQRIDGAIYAVVMESRGLYMARNEQQITRFGNGLRRHLADIRRDAAALAALAEGDGTIPPLLQALDEFITFLSLIHI